MGVFRSDFSKKKVPPLFGGGKGSHAKWTTGDAAALDSKIAHKKKGKKGKKS